MNKNKRILSAITLLLFTVFLFAIAGTNWELTFSKQHQNTKDHLLVAVLDTGYSGDSNRVILESYNALDGSSDISDTNGHGTDMINIIHDHTPKQVTILPVKIADYNGNSTIDAAYQGILYAMEMKADIIHMSLNMTNLDSNSKLIELIKDASASGIDIVVSAGNNGKNTADVFPANIDEVIVVSATDQNGDLIKYSNYGSTIDFASYGYYLDKRGTSYAAARVTAMLADEYICGGNLESLRKKAIDKGPKGKDDYYGYGLLNAADVVAKDIQSQTYISRSSNDLGPRILDLDWKNTDGELLNQYFIETHRAYVGMYLSSMDDEELDALRKKASVLNTNVLVQDFELQEGSSSYKETSSYEENFITNALATYRTYEEELSVSAEFLMLKNYGYFAISSHDRNDIYHFQIGGFSYKVANKDSEWFQMFDPAKLTVTRTIVKQTTGFGAVYVSGLSTYLCTVASFAEEYTNTATGNVVKNNNFFAIDAEAEDGSLIYGLAVKIDGYSNYRKGYHTTETDIVQLPYNYTHTYSQYSYADYPEPLQYVFSYYIPETNDVGFSTVPQRVSVQPKNFKNLMPVTMKIWYDGVYKDGMDYRNVNESLSLTDKLNSYLKSWKVKTVTGVNIYSDETSLTDTGLTINFNLGSSMGIQWNNGETSTVATLSDIPEYNFPLVINTYQIKYNGNGATSGTMANTSMTYDVAKNLSQNTFSRTGYIFKGWSTTANGTVVYEDKQSVINLTEYHDVTVNLYAVWEPISYTIRFHGNGSTSGSMSDMSMTYDVAKKLDKNNYVKTGYIFSGWATTSSGSASYSDEQSVKNLSSTKGAVVHLYAVWSPLTYTIRYHGNGSTSGSMTDSVMTYDKAENLKLNEYEKTGYLFQGWAISSTGPVAYSDGQSVINLTTIPGDVINLYAVWNPISYVIRFHGNGSTSGSMSDITATYDSLVTLPANTYLKTGYTFHSWNTDSSGTGTSYSDGQTVQNLTATHNAIVHLYCIWSANPYTIVFHPNGGTGTMNSIQTTYDSPVTLPNSTFTKSTDFGPSVFTGWHTDSTSLSPCYLANSVVSNLTAEYNGVVTLYAIWDDCPWIIAEDLYYTLKEAKDGFITYIELMSHATAADREDGDPILPVYDPSKGTNFVIIDYQESDFTQLNHSGSVTETFKVTDSIGNTYSKLITVHIVDTTASLHLPNATTRFINEYYYRLPYSQGGLSDSSLWLTDDAYKAVIEACFYNLRNNLPAETYYLNYETILEIKDYIDTNGYGNSINSNALRIFYDLFLLPNKLSQED
ncbi:MAG: InlB B-repeat-containing protein [Lachnospiraceae bacterium]|nr:InlB B-repeat-containing protein [Lachnospiraceae bacterium]